MGPSHFSIPFFFKNKIDDFFSTVQICMPKEAFLITGCCMRTSIRRKISIDLDRPVYFVPNSFAGIWEYKKKSWHVMATDDSANGGDQYLFSTFFVHPSAAGNKWRIMYFFFYMLLVLCSLLFVYSFLVRTRKINY